MDGCAPRARRGCARWVQRVLGAKCAAAALLVTMAGMPQCLSGHALVRQQDEESEAAQLRRLSDERGNISGEYMG